MTRYFLTGNFNRVILTKWFGERYGEMFGNISLWDFENIGGGDLGWEFE